MKPEQIRNQGESILTCERLEQISIVPRGFMNFPFDPPLAGIFAPQEIENDMA